MPLERWAVGEEPLISKGIRYRQEPVKKSRRSVALSAQAIRNGERLKFVSSGQTIKDEIDRLRGDHIEPTLILAGRDAWRTLFDMFDFDNDPELRSFQPRETGTPAGLVGFIYGLPVYGIDTSGPDHLSVHGRARLVRDDVI